MSDSGYTGYLFEFARDDLNAKDGLDKSRIIAVARSVDEAMAAVGDLAPRESLELIEVGADVLAEARMAGVENDGSKLVNALDQG